ncbi:unnamed protein product [Owenia fusiformis]|uniref:Uncharacterized protein n=1 Tax=Owenia fusiformis TaxID=6347 RepID=A0A8J1T5V7_OWEFU|nr:unnamed protein product [Owenia fusiformis]
MYNVTDDIQYHHHDIFNDTDIVVNDTPKEAVGEATNFSSISNADTPMTIFEAFTTTKAPIKTWKDELYQDGYVFTVAVLVFLLIGLMMCYIVSITRMSRRRFRVTRAQTRVVATGREILL